MKRRPGEDRVTYLRRSYRRARRQMKLHKVLWRAFSGPEIKSALRHTFGTRTVHVTAKTRRRDLRRAARNR